MSDPSFSPNDVLVVASAFLPKRKEKERKKESKERKKERKKEGRKERKKERKSKHEELHTRQQRNTAKKKTQTSGMGESAQSSTSVNV